MSVEHIPPGHPLRSRLEALHDALPDPPVLAMSGALRRATLVPAPEAPVVPLEGPLYLVHGTATPVAGGVEIMVLVSWSDRGLPRMAAGRLEDAVSEGVHLIPLGVGAPTAQPAKPSHAAPPASVPKPAQGSLFASDVPPWEDAPEPAPAEPAPRNRPRKTARTASARGDAQVDLSAEMALLGGPPAPEPEPAQPASGGGWGAAVSASAPPPKTEAPSGGGWGAAVSASAPAPKPTAPTGGGWGAAVSASKPPSRGRASRPADMSDLGFDVDGPPDLRPGDLLLHPRFGRCKVARGGRDKVKVRRPTGGHFDLALKVCTFTRLPDEEGRRVFQVRIGKSGGGRRRR